MMSAHYRCAIPLITLSMWSKCVFVAMTVSVCPCLAQLKTIPLPEIRIDGNVTKVHSQGLYVTDRHFLVTGRLETKPKRALLFRFSRKDPSVYEFADLTPPIQGGEVLDHPGGFDRDANGTYWIPVSTSHRRGPTIIYGLTLDPDKPLRESIVKRSSIRFADHLGALSCMGDELLAANWDTKTIYQLQANGETRQKIDRSKFVRDQAGWFLAVQDWKWDSQSELIIAGGIDKSPSRDKLTPRAMIQWIDPKLKRIVRTERLKALDGVTRPLTNEGMAWHDGQLFLLPEDLNAGAKIIHFSELVSKADAPK